MPLTSKNFSGRYIGSDAGLELDLRVDVDGERPMRCVSGDFFTLNGAHRAYQESFIVDNIDEFTIGRPSNKRIAMIKGRCRWSTSSRKTSIAIKILFDEDSRDPGPATVGLVRPSGNKRTETYSCEFESSHFREVSWELDWVAGTQWLVPTIMGDSTAQGPIELTVNDVYRRAGIKLDLLRDGTSEVPISEAGSDRKWTEKELHDAMQGSFDHLSSGPQWTVYMLVATSSKEEGKRGCMFDKVKDPPPRQGCAVFADEFKGLNGKELQRAILRTCVHELGHCFNLPHPWAVGATEPSAPEGDVGGYGARCWMNMPETYTPWGYTPPKREDAPRAWGDELSGRYWSEFPFSFTDRELIHLRHAFYMDIVFGGNKYIEVESLNKAIDDAVNRLIGHQ